MGVDNIANLKGSSQAAGSLVPQHVAITDTLGNVINTFGGGTQYTQGDTDASLTGTVAMGEGPSDTVTALQTDAAGILKTGGNNLTGIAAIQATASGDTSLISSGTRKLRRVEASNSHATTALTVGLKIPSLNSGSVFGKKYLPAAGGLAVWVFPDGYLPVTSEAVSVNLSGAGQVEVTAYYE